jgi:hypothetical protein
VLVKQPSPLGRTWAISHFLPRVLRLRDRSIVVFKRSPIFRVARVASGTACGPSRWLGLPVAHHATRLRFGSGHCSHGMRLVQLQEWTSTPGFARRLQLGTTWPEITVPSLSGCATSLASLARRCEEYASRAEVSGHSALPTSPNPKQGVSTVVGPWRDARR